MPKESKLLFADGFLGLEAKAAKARGESMKTFDWDKAAKIIKDHLAAYPNLIAEAGLQGDWSYTGGTIFEEGKPTNESYTYLASIWAVPTIIISSDDEEIVELECYTQEESRFTSASKWDDKSLEILGINLN